MIRQPANQATITSTPWSLSLNLTSISQLHYINTMPLSHANFTVMFAHF